MPPSKNISFDELSKYFHLPINQVAKELGVCATILKKICRRNGIPRWPHRKIKSIEKMISNLELNLNKNPQEKEDIRSEIDLLTNKKIEIMKNPELLAKGHDYSAKGNKSKFKSHRGPYAIKTFKVKELSTPDVATPAVLMNEREPHRALLDLTRNVMEADTSAPFAIEVPKSHSGMYSFRPLAQLGSEKLDELKYQPSTHFELPPPITTPFSSFGTTALVSEMHQFPAFNLGRDKPRAYPGESIMNYSMNRMNSPVSYQPDVSLPSWFLEEKKRVLGQ